MWLEPISRVDVAGEMRLDVVVWLDDSGLPMFWNGYFSSPRIKTSGPAKWHIQINYMNTPG
jgi:hypothetical protein